MSKFNEKLAREAATKYTQARNKERPLQPFEDYYKTPKAFEAGARWQHEQDSAELSSLRSEIETLNYKITCYQLDWPAHTLADEVNTLKAEINSMQAEADNDRHLASAITTKQQRDIEALKAELAVLYNSDLYRQKEEIKILRAGLEYYKGEDPWTRDADDFGRVASTTLAAANKVRDGK